MNCTSYDQPYPRGEIYVRGPIVFQGYYKDEVQTREVIDEEVWLHTGDIGLWSPGGRLKIIDRICDNFNSSLVAIVCVDPDMLKAWAAKEGIKFESLEQLCNDPRARKVVLAIVIKSARFWRLGDFLERCELTALLLAS
ncbi:putative long-chain-fatty-acid--CoA ligase [Helianthus debilis subsp. tardiflorus]